MSKAHDFFEEHEDEFLKTERVTRSNWPTRAADTNAFILIDRLFPNEPGDVVVAAEHDQIFLKGDPDRLFETDSPATEEDLLDLIRCGVFLDSGTNSFSMFV